MITAESVKNLRLLTGAGIMDCKQALAKFKGDQKEAIAWLRKKNLASAVKKATRVANEGMIGTYVHGEGRIGVMVEINSETDFVAKNDVFQNFVKDVAMQIAAMNPLVVSEDDLPTELIEEERKILKARAIDEGKKPEILDKIIEGQISKWKASQSLLSQPYVKDSNITCKDVLTETVGKLGENVVIKRFVRYELGEGQACE